MINKSNKSIDTIKVILIVIIISSLTNYLITTYILDQKIKSIDSRITHYNEKIEEMENELININLIINNLSLNMTKNLDTNITKIPNPAAVFCIEVGGKYEIRIDNEGNQYGVCIIDGLEYDAWDYYLKNKGGS
jgi:putative hemolysin